MGQIWDWGSIWLRKMSLLNEWLTLASDALGAAVEGATKWLSEIASSRCLNGRFWSQ